MRLSSTINMCKPELTPLMLAFSSQADCRVGSAGRS